MAAGAADGFFRYIYEGSLAGGDMDIQRRPYHRNCRCALHNKSKDGCTHGLSRCKNVMYPMRRSWSEGCLALAAASASSCHSSPSSSPSLQQQVVVEIGRTTSSNQLRLWVTQEEDDDDPTLVSLSPKV